MNTNQNKSNARETNFFTFFFFGSLSVLEFSLHSSSVIRSAVRVSCKESKIGLVTTLQGQLRAHEWTTTADFYFITLVMNQNAPLLNARAAKRPRNQKWLRFESRRGIRFIITGRYLSLLQRALTVFSTVYLQQRILGSISYNNILCFKHRVHKNLHQMLLYSFCWDCLEKSICNLEKKVQNWEEMFEIRQRRPGANIHVLIQFI